MEIGDIYAVNKSDLDGAEEAAIHIERNIAATHPALPNRPPVTGRKLDHPVSHAVAARHGNPGIESLTWVPPVLRVSATAQKGIKALGGSVDQFFDWSSSTGRRDARHRMRVERQLRDTYSAFVLDQLLAGFSARMTNWIDDICAGKASPMEAVRDLANHDRDKPSKSPSL